MYFAVKGNGAFCNGTPINVDQAITLPQAFVCTNFGHTKDPEILARQMHCTNALHKCIVARKS